MSNIISDVSKRTLIVKGMDEVRWIELCNKDKDIIKVKNLHDDIWQVDLIKRVGSYYRNMKKIQCIRCIYRFKGCKYDDWLKVRECENFVPRTEETGFDN